uniref:C2H2-type domain-containing protein n=1 Tax=Trichobilharzia regenti TaxID=157069 RepID=A0AA85JKU7_TRIRE|nr:unnamed protein product [Trichobilharzia regenti]
MERFNSRSHRFYSPDINETDEDNAYLPFSGNLHNRNMSLGHMSFFSTASSNSSLSSGLSDTNSTQHLGQTAAIGSATNRFGLTDGLLSHDHSENIGQSLHDICTNSSATSRSVYSRLNAYNVDGDYNGVDENLQTLSSHDSYRGVYNGNFIQNTRNTSTMSSLVNSNHMMHEYDMSPYCSLVSFQNNIDGQNFCIDCRYNHIHLGVQTTCSCLCHNESKEVTITPILNYTYTATSTTTTTNNNNNRSMHSLNRPLSSDNYPTPTKHSWNSSTPSSSSSTLLSTITHPGLPSLTNPFTSEQYNHNSVNNTNAFGYFPISSPSILNNRLSNNNDSSSRDDDSPSPSTLDMTGDIRTVNFISHDQPPLRT